MNREWKGVKGKCVICGVKTRVDYDTDLCGFCFADRENGLL